MSVCTLIASDAPLNEVVPLGDHPFEMWIDNGTVTINDGGADDNYFLKTFADVRNYTDREYGVQLEWHYTDGRAARIIEYIKNALQAAETVEIWRIWLMDYYEFENRPFIRREKISIDELTVQHIKEIDDARIWNTPDKMYPDRPSFYCLTVKR